MSVAVEHAIPERDAGTISRLIDICRSERRTVLDHYSPEEEAKYIMNLGPRAAVFVARVDGEFAGFAGIAPRWDYSQRLRHCGEGGTWVKPEFRRRGVATALWREGILPFCRDAGFRHVGHFVMAHTSVPSHSMRTSASASVGATINWLTGTESSSTPWRCG